MIRVRWAGPIPGSGYECWDGSRWREISPAEIAKALASGITVHYNPVEVE